MNGGLVGNALEVLETLGSGAIGIGESHGGGGGGSVGGGDGYCRDWRRCADLCGDEDEDEDKEEWEWEWEGKGERLEE